MVKVKEALRDLVKRKKLELCERQFGEAKKEVCPVCGQTTFFYDRRWGMECVGPYGPIICSWCDAEILEGCEPLIYSHPTDWRIPVRPGEVDKYHCIGCDVKLRCSITPELLDRLRRIEAIAIREPDLSC